MAEETTHGGAAVAATLDGEAAFIHVVASNLEEALEGGWDASVYVRAGGDARSWGERLLVEGMSPRVAAAGQDVYIAFVAYRCGAGTGFLHNDDHGRLDAWSKLACLTRDSELDSDWAPVIAATESRVYVASVDWRTHEVSVHISSDTGTTWRRVPLDVARVSEEHGPTRVEVAAAGEVAAVAWTELGVTTARVSVDGGETWGEATQLSEGVVTSGSANGGLVVFGGNSATGTPWIRMWAATGDWKPIPMPAVRDPSQFDVWGVLVRLSAGGRRLGAVVCEADPTQEGGHPGIPVWVMSSDRGTTWSTPERVPGACAESIEWLDDSVVYLLTYPDDGYGVVAGTVTQ